MNIISTLTYLLVASIAAPSHAAGDPSSYFDSVDNTVYLDWVTLNVTNYDASVYLPSPANEEMGVALHWKLDGDSILLAVAARATGWVGFGIGEAGGMKGSDMVIFETATNDIFDAHVLGNINAGPVRDDCQNWELTNLKVDDGFIIFEVTRLIDTGDSFDRAIVDDSDLFVAPHRVIAAWGETEKVSYHGADNRVRSSIRFHRQGIDEMTEFQETMSEGAEGSFELRAVDYPIKAIDTEYRKFCFAQTDLVQLGMRANTDLHVVGIEPVIDEDAKRYVHHFVLYASERTNEGDGTQDFCDGIEQEETAYSWAPGEGPFTLPSNVGGPLGTGGFQSYQLEIHYDNPSLITGAFDSSGVRMFFTSKKREHDMGILELGDGDIFLAGQSVAGFSASGYTTHSFTCPDSCSWVSISETVNVIRETMHMHLTGQSVSNEQIRDGKVIRTGAIDYWDMDQQGDMVIQQKPFEIMPGDSFRTRCSFKADADMVWGESSQEEMCMASVYYYPRQVVFDSFPFTCVMGMAFDECKSKHEAISLDDAEGLERTFGRPGDGLCPLSNSAASDTPNTSPTETSAPTTSGKPDTSNGRGCLSAFGEIMIFAMVTIVLNFLYA